MGIHKPIILPFLFLFITSALGVARPDIRADREAVPRVQEVLGAKLSVTESYIRRSIISTRTPYGFKIASVEKDSPADRAGWKKGDILLTFDGKPVKRTAELLKWIRSVKPGAEIPFEISRRTAKLLSFSRDPWKKMAGTITFRNSFEITAYRIRKDREARPAVKDALGAHLSIGESYIRRSIISTRTPYGFKIASVEKDSPADRAGWKKGDILLTFDGKPVKSAAELLKWIRSGKPGAEIPFEISRRKAKLLEFSRDPFEDIAGTIKLN